MNFTEIIYNCINEVVTITLNRPESLNALSITMAKEIIRAIEQARSDDNCKVVVITGSGRAFCAGGDIKAMKIGMSVAKARNYVLEIGRLILAMQDLEKPIIAAVNGYAMGAGFNVVLAADLIIAAKEAKFGQAFLQVGLAIDAGGSYFLPRTVGLVRAKELAFTGRIIDAEEALNMGLINKVVERERLEQEVYSLAAKLAQDPSQALGLTKMLINRGLSADLETALAYEALAQSVCMQTEDHKEGLAAFLEKRAPKFKGK
ncbi:Enoyl-CoA hydratase/isomerase [Desulfofundulus kuznetsovii DSM 6115]|uniref:short-chain-enoyl-CoA hydratase n=1 Tax=Desulfofundulus kuznetsovii (strain DSM 6115 / VKM B-1805 / 17) TaxID=760568 RepID=A0AAU8P9D1_DESK7|nr:Enoyl-CoA hydratase/isomerase [Desulfofundulus kuznetsovii DSM 6115]